MKIVADQEISGAAYYFGGIAELVLKSGRAICADDVRDADVLLVRSVTRVNEKLLKDSAVKFVGSVTTGADHLDTTWLDQHNIAWSTAKGCNADAVIEYVICTVAAVQKLNFLGMEKPKAAVIGVGQIGQGVVQQLIKLGFDVIQCDPLRAEQESEFPHVPLEKINDVDLISLHVPLMQIKPHATYHLIEESFLARQKEGCILLNTSRGEVIDFAALKKAGQHLQWCLDVWENEPHIDIEIVQRALIATPHIAGYSVQSKMRGIEMIYQKALAQHVIPHQQLNKIQFPRCKMTAELSSPLWQDAVLKIFNPLVLTEKMKGSLAENPNQFDWLRKNFNDRYEFAFVD